MADISLFKFQKKLYAVERLEPDAHELGAQMKATQTLVQFLSTKEYFLASTSALMPFSETTIEIHIGGRDKKSLDLARELLGGWLEAGHEWLHRRVRRFHKKKTVDGTIVKWAPAEGDDEALWKMMHDDGDEEDLDEEEVEAALRAYDAASSKPERKRRGGAAPATSTAPAAKRRSKIKDEAAADEPPPEPMEALPEPEPERPSSSSSSEPSSSSGGEFKSEYELQRDENIRQNNLILAQLELLEAAAEVRAPEKKKATPTARGVKKEKKEAAPARARSLRAQGIAPDGTMAAGVAAERADGSVVLVAGEVIRYRQPEVAAPWKPRHPEGDVEFEPLTLGGAPAENGADDDAAFIAKLRPPGGGGGGKKKAAAAKEEAPAAAAELVGAPLRESEMAKVTKDGTTHLAFQPRSDSLIVAAGDKKGYVGLWDVGAADDATDGVRLLSPHEQYISGLAWEGRSGGARLFTASYDGSVRRLDVGTGGAVWELAHGDPNGEEYSAMCDGTDGRLWLATNDGDLCAVDARAPSMSVGLLSIHEQKVNTVSVSPGREWLLATAASECGAQGAATTVRVWDVRKLEDKAESASLKAKGPAHAGKPLHFLPHGKSCQAAFWAPDGSDRLLTTSWDCALRVWDGVGAASGKAPEITAPARKITHDTATGRWIIPFRAIWTAAADGVVVGSMARGARRATLYDAKSGKKLHDFIEPELLSAIPSRCAAHPTLPAIAAATSSGRIHVFRK